MAKSKSPAKGKAAKTKVSGKDKPAPKKSASKLAKAATSILSVLAPKKSATPATVAKRPTPVAKAPPAPKPAREPVANKPAANHPPAASAWSESLRKAMQEKNSQKPWPENKTDWKDRQRAGLSMTHRNKFG